MKITEKDGREVGDEGYGRKDYSQNGFWACKKTQ